MSPTVFAMKHPITTICLVVGLICGGALAYSRMRVDIFPSLNTPQIYVFLDYVGMSPDQIEGFIVNQLELYFQYVDGIKDIDSRNIQQVSLCKLSFYPGTNMGQAMAQVVAMSNRAMSWMPKGTLPPMIMRMDAGSVPVGYLVLESKEASLGQLGDWAQNLIRPQVQKNVPGTVAISPFGPNMRSIIINVDPHKLHAYNLTPQQVVDALHQGNTIIPAGNVYIRDSMPVVNNNATVNNVQRLGSIPLRIKKNVYLRDVATIVDDTDITYGYALVNGKKSVYLPIIKTDTGSTLTVVADTKRSMDLFRSVIPKEYRDKVKISFQFDESPTVLAAVKSVATEGAIGAFLTGLMILLFLRDLRSAAVVVANIPLALLGALFGLYATGNTINIMSLGGMALAIGILVDMSTVTIENVHVQMGHTRNVATAVLHASNATAVPILLALLCILSVFVPAFIMQDPLRVAVHAADAGRRLRHDLLVSALEHVRAGAVRLHAQAHGRSRGAQGRAVRPAADRVRQIGGVVRAAAPVGGARVFRDVRRHHRGPRSATRDRAVPANRRGAVRAALRPPPGANFELTRQMAVKCLEVIEEEAGEDNVEISMGYVGQVAPNFGIDNMVLFMRGPDDGQLRVALKEEGGIHLDEFRERLRKRLPEKVRPWLARRLAQGGLHQEDAERQAKMATFGFEPGDIVSSVMSFGSLAPLGGSPRRHRPGRRAQARGENLRRDEAHSFPPRRAIRANRRLPNDRGGN